ncbi:hypothetical protein ABEB36_008743 [Hypothenemus hampei]|uniref:SET domain-containing protein n=1 Tax=Hypothenemus hampei TaxID=57062 RepID=A0ABD1ENI0_HYPHA
MLNYKICDEVLEPYLVATRDIKPGEIIIQEPPLLIGPSQVTVPICLGCNKAIDVEKFKPCSKCGWPVCDSTCEKSPNHIPDCQYTVSKGSKVTISTFGSIHPYYQCITVLRCLYQKQFLPDIWNKINVLQSRCSERKSTSEYEKDRISIAQFILRFFKLKHIFNEEEVLRICGIVKVNAHEVPLTTPPYLALYETSSTLTHSCSPNCNKTFTKNGSLIIKAGTHIKKGEQLFLCYTDPLWGTMDRRRHLYETKFFWCSCKRCSDSTEFFTYFNAVRCQSSDCSGYLLPPTFLEQSINRKLPNWICNKCSCVNSSNHVQEILDRIGLDFKELPEKDIAAAINFLTIYEKYLHNNHYYLTKVKYTLSQLIGHEHETNLPQISDENLARKAKFCQNIVNLLNILAPGESRKKGLILFELHATVAELGRRNADPHQLVVIIQEAKKILIEASEALKHESECFPEGQIYIQALKNLKEMEVVLITLHQKIGDACL